MCSVRSSSSRVGSGAPREQSRSRTLAAVRRSRSATPQIVRLSTRLDRCGSLPQLAFKHALLRAGRAACASFAQQTVCTPERCRSNHHDCGLWKTLAQLTASVRWHFHRLPQHSELCFREAQQATWDGGDAGAVLHWNGTALLPELVGSSQSLRAVASVMTPGGSEQWIAGYGGTPGFGDLALSLGTRSSCCNDRWEIVVLTKRGADPFVLVGGMGVRQACE